MREVCRSTGGPWPGADVVFLAKGPILDAAYIEVEESVRRAVNRSEWLEFIEAR